MDLLSYAREKRAIDDECYVLFFPLTRIVRSVNWHRYGGRKTSLSLLTSLRTAANIH